MRTRTVDWFEGRAIRAMTRRDVAITPLGLAARVLHRDGLRSIEEQQNYDIAVQNLISQRLISQTKDQDGMTVYVMN